MIVLQILLYILGLFFGLVLLWWVAGMVYSLTVTQQVYKRTTWFARFLSIITNGGAFVLTRSHVKVMNKDLLPKDTNFVFVSNHRSRFDPMAVMYKMARYRVGFISKPSNFKIPFFGKILRKLCFLQIDRDDPHKAMQTINDAVAILKEGDASIGFYPEGTRSKDGTLGPFHDFMFRIPKLADKSVVVAVTRGTEDVAKKFPFPGGARVSIKILGVLDVDYIRTHRPVEIGQRVEAMMREELGQ